jgi:hypothetical protein
MQLRLSSILVTFALAACGGSEDTGGQSPASTSTPDSETTTTAGTAATSTTTGRAPAAAGAGAASTPRTPAQTLPAAGRSGSSTAGVAGAAGTSSSASAGQGGASAAAGSGAAAAGNGAAGSAGAAAGGEAPATPTSGAATGRTFDIVTMKVTDAPTFNVTRPMDLSVLDGQPLPVVVWANGGCFRSDFTWSPLFERWAKAGFVVLTLTGTGGEDDIAGMLSQTSKREHAQLIDWVIQQNESGEYAGKLDTTKIVVAGNSCGGVTALEVAGSDERPAAVFVLSGSSAVGSVNTQVMQNVKVPVGYIVGGDEDIAGANAKGDYEAMNEGLPAMIVHRREGDHQTVSTDTEILPENAEISLNWMDLALYGTKAAHVALTSPNVCDGCTPGDWKLESKNLETLVK